MRAFVVLLVAAVGLSACVTEGDQPAGPRDLGPPQDFGTCGIDGGAPVDLGFRVDLGPFVAPDLDAAEPAIPDLGPDYLLGCRKLTFCTGYPSDPPGLTWDNYAHDFFATYCTRCHSSANVGSTARHGAPDGRDWDDRTKVNMYLPLIRRYVGEQMYMPFDEPWTLSCGRRRELVTWIDEGAP